LIVHTFCLFSICIEEVIDKYIPAFVTHIFYQFFVQFHLEV